MITEISQGIFVGLVGLVAYIIVVALIAIFKQ